MSIMQELASPDNVIRYPLAVSLQVSLEGWCVSHSPAEWGNEVQVLITAKTQITEL